MSFFGKIFGSKKQSKQNSPGDYSGDKVDGKRQGHGTIRFENGDTYSGEWHYDLMHGTGEYVFAKSGEKYMGEFKSDKISGQGRFYYSNGSVYDGGFLSGKRNGVGTMTYKNGDRYEGSWIDDKKSGYGKLFYADGRSYCGMFFDGEMTDGFMTAKNKNGMWEKIRCGTRIDYKATPIVMLVSYPENRKIHIIKEIREYTGCGLALAKDISENVPQLLKTSATAADIEAARAKFEPLGAEIRID